MKRQDFDQNALAPLTSWSYMGERTNNLGTRLIGHLPHIAPKAYLHVIFAPSKSEEFVELEARLGRPVPVQLQQLFAIANGMMIFSGAIRVLGFLPYERKGLDSPHNYPSDIVRANTAGRPEGRAVIVGFYKHDGSHSWIDGDGRVIHLSKKGSAREWPDFDTWLFSEIAHLSHFFDQGGNVMADPEDIFAPRS